jgi:hypothetical protein
MKVDVSIEPDNPTPANVTADEIETRVVEAIRALAPSSLEAFIAGLERDLPSELNHTHLLAERLDVWVTDDDVGALFAYNEAAHLRRLSFVKNFTAATCSLGMQAKELKSRSGETICVLSCTACNTPYDAGTHLCHEGSTVTKLHIDEMRLPGTAARDGSRSAHSALLYLAVVVGLLKWPCAADSATAHGQDRLLDLLVEEPPPETASVQRWMVDCLLGGEMWRVPLPVILGVVDNCCAPLPKAAYLAMALMSLVVARRPAATLSLLDPIPTAGTVYVNFLTTRLPGSLTTPAAKLTNPSDLFFPPPHPTTHPPPPPTPFTHPTHPPRRPPPPPHLRLRPRGALLLPGRGILRTGPDLRRAALPVPPGRLEGRTRTRPTRGPLNHDGLTGHQPAAQR